MNNSSRVLLAFIGGLAAGAVLGVLYAPDEGRKTRERLRARLNEYMNQLREQMNANGQQTEAQTGHTQASDASRQDYKKAEELLKEVEGLLDDIKVKSHDKK